MWAWAIFASLRHEHGFLAASKMEVRYRVSTGNEERLSLSEGINMQKVFHYILSRILVTSIGATLLYLFVLKLFFYRPLPGRNGRTST